MARKHVTPDRLRELAIEHNKQIEDDPDFGIQLVRVGRTDYYAEMEKAS